MTSTFAALSNNLAYAAIAVYALALLAYAIAPARQAAAREAPRTDAIKGGQRNLAAPTVLAVDESADRWQRLTRVGTSLTVLALALNLAAVLARSLAAGRAPWGNMYEFSLVGAAAITAAYLVILHRHPVHLFGVWVAALSLLTLGLGITVLYTPADDLVPVLNSYWLVIHVAAAIIAGGIFTVGAIACVLFLLRLSAERPAAERLPRVQRYARRLPPAERLDRVAHGASVVAFPIWTFAVIAGAIWAEDSWGRYWGWDPKETWAFITWILYATYLHAQSTAGWRGGKASVFAVAGYLAFLFNFIGVNIWLPGLHSYAGV